MTHSTSKTLPIIEIKNLSKKYFYGQKTSSADQLNIRESIANLGQKIFSFNNSKKASRQPSTKLASDEFWALKNINFSVGAGEKIGIIGANGAGKSTILKLISRITSPSKGEITLRGRVASLLEVGSGFHAELTGRENIYLNGSILGMTKKEIDQKFDDIVLFSEIGDFIDSPFKHYSSGMGMKLAFAVAAFLEPEILLIDEVLAVGDMSFQRKSLQKMQEISQKEGKTIIFVSHDLGAIAKLCDRGIFLDHGEIKYLGPVDQAVQKYVDHKLDRAALLQTSPIINLTAHPHKKNPQTGLTQVEVLVNDQPSLIFHAGDDLKLRCTFHNQTPLVEPNLGFYLKNPKGQILLYINNRYTGHELQPHLTDGIITMHLPKLPLYGEGPFFFDLAYGSRGDNFDLIEDAFYLEVEPTDYYQSGVLLKPTLSTFTPTLKYTETKCRPPTP